MMEDLIFGIPSNAFWTIVGVASALIVALTILLVSISRTGMLSQYNEMLRRAELSELRQHYEVAMAKLAGEMTATEARFKEVNHLVISAQASQGRLDAYSPEPENFFRSMGVDFDSIKVDPRLVFVLTPFTEEQRPAYDIIQRVCTESGLVCVRGDEQFTRGQILPHILRLMAESRIVIANISGRNANVFYELGLAHAIGKQTIIVSETISDVPFDVASMRMVIFRDERELIGKIKTALIQSLK